VLIVIRVIRLREIKWWKIVVDIKNINIHTEFQSENLTILFGKRRHRG
jgi:hypothetical protein